MNDKLIIALDVPDLAEAKKLVRTLSPEVRLFKIGSELFTACGPDAVKLVNSEGGKVFLDLKFHDIPNTVAGAVRSASRLGVFMLNIHASGGYDMMKAAREAAGPSAPPFLIAVTILTSLDGRAAREAGYAGTPGKTALKMALLAKRAGMNGVVCSPGEISSIKKEAGKDFIVVTPGIRTPGKKRDDQRRVMTARDAIRKGADFIVVGRPVTRADSPLAAAREILRSFA